VRSGQPASLTFLTLAVYVGARLLIRRAP